MEQDALRDELRKMYEDVLSKYAPYTPEDPEYDMFDGKIHPGRLLATSAKIWLDENPV